MKLERPISPIRRDLELVAEVRRRPIVASARAMITRVCGDGAPVDLPPERQPALLEIREIHRVVHVPHRVAVAKAHAEPVTEREIDRHAR